MHYRIAGLALMTAFVLSAARAGGADAKEDLAALQGTWKLVSLEINGEMAEIGTPASTWVIRGDKVHYGGAPLAVLKLDASTNPRNVDLHLIKPERVLEGVYAVEGDTFKLCVNRQADGVKERPLGFSTKDKALWSLLVFKRLKDGEAEAPGGFVGVAIALDKDKKSVLVGQVLPDSPAKAAGLKRGDVILKVGGTGATDLRGVVAMCRQARPGSDLTLRVRRDGEERDVVIKVGVLPFFLLD
jgi:uncharacterized protein (TIGR03067 family)